jgi:hypothetical protein
MRCASQAEPLARRGTQDARGTIETVDVAPLATLTGLLLLKEIGVPIPVPGDILVLGAGAATSGRPEAAAWLLAILLAGYVGGTIQFFLVRGAMRGPLLALLRKLGVPRPGSTPWPRRYVAAASGPSRWRARPRVCA